MSDIPEYETLIVGAGPAGASLACFLASHGIRGLMVSIDPGSTRVPRAHITNMAGLECLRDIGLDQECLKLATRNDSMVHTRWCHSMAGEEFARIHSWGNSPDRKGDYERASPCDPVDLPQTLLEPILVRYAILNGFKCRFDTGFVSFSENKETGIITTTLKDMITGGEYKVRSKFLFGADGARSNIVRQLQLPLYKQPNQGVAINVLVEADLSHIMESRTGNLHWCIQPDRENPDWGWMGIARMVKPWHEWMMIIFPRPGADVTSITEEQWLHRVREFIGDDSIPVSVIDISTWRINEIVAEKYSEGNVICLGDAVHRHPPFNGLGSNTCLQDAFNLAWKIAYYLKGLAPRSLLDTFSIERQPVGHSVIKRANDGFREHFHVWEAIGILPHSLEERKAIYAELSAATPEGQKRRKQFQEAINQTAHEFHGLGIEMGQRYTGPGIYVADEPEEYKRVGPAKDDPILYYEMSTYPGCRLPHAWLNTAAPGKQISTIDLAGHGGFTLLTGVGGQPWREAGDAVSEELKIPVKTYSIGFRQDWEDVYFDWEKIRAVDETGVVLVRPDRVVAWRTPKVLANVDECASKLTRVMRSILGFEGS